METDKYRSKAMPHGIESTALDANVAKVLRNTYLLLSVTLAFSAVMAGVAMAINAPYFGLWTLLPYVICLWMVEKNKNSASGIIWVFALTGWMGFTLGPILSMFLATRGAEPIIIGSGYYCSDFLCCLSLCVDDQKEFELYDRLFNDRLAGCLCRRYCQFLFADTGAVTNRQCCVCPAVFSHDYVADQCHYSRW